MLGLKPSRDPEVEGIVLNVNDPYVLKYLNFDHQLKLFGQDWGYGFVWGGVSLWKGCFQVSKIQTIYTSLSVSLCLFLFLPLSPFACLHSPPTWSFWTGCKHCRNCSNTSPAYRYTPCHDDCRIYYILEL